MGMTINTDKTKVTIIKSKKVTYTNFVYDNNNLEEVTSYNIPWNRFPSQDQLEL